MKSVALFRIFIFGLIATLLLSLLSLFSLKKIMDYGANEHRRFFILSMAKNIERRPLDKSSLDFTPGRKFPRPRFRESPNPGGPPPFLEPPHSPPTPLSPTRPPGARFRGPKRLPPLNIWLVTDAGEVISSNSSEELPRQWKDSGLPQKAHDIVSDDSFFKISPALTIVRLDTQAPAYLVVLPEDVPLFSGPLFIPQAFLTFSTVFLAIFFSLFFTFLYLRRKSQAAKMVLLRLERGDLKARFEIKRVDEFGNLLLDFNRMADEIERLVLRIHETEKSRKNLLQELGHDLRTPLTSLTTAYETLKFHFDKINTKDREDLFNIIGGEIHYLRDLLEKLLTIATLDEPHYKKTTELINLDELIAQEVKHRQNAGSSNASLDWIFQTLPSPTKNKVLLGDPHLLLRLLRNGLDNAARYARKKIEISLVEKDHQLEIHIDDDGPGFSAAALESFGVRKEYRARTAKELDYSIGLGSVIMKTIAELHGGRIDIHNRFSGNETLGAHLQISLPK